MTALELREKEIIREGLRAYCSRFESQNRAANSLNNISAGTVSTILNGKFESVSDEMFRSVRAQILTPGPSPNGEGRGWTVVETPLFRDVTGVLVKAQKESEVTWVIAPAGAGKTLSAQAYIREHRNVYYLLCDEDMKKWDFVRELAQAVGLKFRRGTRIREILMAVIALLGEQDRPLLILDEGDKLNDNILYYFITIYNRLVDKAGMVFLSTSYMQRRMQNGINYDKKGYQEIQSRIGSKFFMAELNTAAEVNAIARANGIADERTIAVIVKDAEGCRFDLRRVYKKVNAERNKELRTKS
jgi:hypothetical protein